jgi:hypothetical protein
MMQPFWFAGLAPTPQVGAPTMLFLLTVKKTSKWPMPIVNFVKIGWLVQKFKKGGRGTDGIVISKAWFGSLIKGNFCFKELVICMKKICLVKQMKVKPFYLVLVNDTFGIKRDTGSKTVTDYLTHHPKIVFSSASDFIYQINAAVNGCYLSLLQSYV